MKMKIRDTLIITNTILIITTAVVIITIFFTGTRSAVYSIANQLMGEILNSVKSEAKITLEKAENANNEIATRYWDNDWNNIWNDSEREFDYFLQMIKSNDTFTSVYVADTDGKMIMQQRMPDNSFSRRYVSQDSENIHIQYVHENRAYNISYPTHTEDLQTGYDPRRRSWYTLATKNKQLSWTDVYVFSASKMPGLTCSMPIYKDDGELHAISCIDIDILDLSLFLGKINITPNSKLFILDKNGQILAQPIDHKNNAKILFSEDNKLKTAEKCNDTVIAASFKQQFENNEPFTFKVANKMYFSQFSSLTTNTGLNLDIGIIIPDSDIMHTFYKNCNIVFAISLLVIILVIILSFFISAFISKPLKLLSLEMNEIKKLSLSDNINIHTSIREIDEMLTSFDGMKKGITNFKKYIPSEVVSILMEKQQEANIGGEEKELTMFFSDIENFTNISESIPPQALLSQLCDYFSAMSRTILDNEGTLDKYIGDSIMAFWGAPNTLENHAYLACKSALICQDLIFNLSHVWKREGKYPFRTRMGIHTGKVIVGNMGYEKRINYTVLGDNVNLASRLESINKYYNTSIIVSENTYELVKDKFEFRTLDRITVKGKSHPVTIYELLANKGGMGKNKLKLYKLYEEGVKCYFNGEWLKSIKYMDTILKYMQDQPTMIIRERSSEYLKNPPKDWNGVHVFHDK